MLSPLNYFLVCNIFIVFLYIYFYFMSSFIFTSFSRVNELFQLLNPCSKKILPTENYIFHFNYYYYHVTSHSNNLFFFTISHYIFVIFSSTNILVLLFFICELRVLRLVFIIIFYILLFCHLFLLL